MECGEWETRPAPQGRLLVDRDADAIFSIPEDWREWDGIPHDAAAGDVDGDGCSEIVLSHSSWTDSDDLFGNIYRIPGPLAGAFHSPGPYTAIIEAPSDHYLTQLSLGDMDGDGSRDDWLFGAFCGGDNGLGAVYLFPEPLSGTYVEDDAVAAIWAPDTIASTSAGLSTGDVDGDGVDDVALGWYVWGDDGFVDPELGVYYGPLVGVRTYEDADASFRGHDRRVGENMSLEADLDGDGLHDLIYGSQMGWGEQDHVLVFRGPVAGAYRREDADLFMETEIDAGVGVDFPLSAGPDADGDGYDDLLVAENSETYSKAWLVLGGLDPISDLGDAHATFTGANSWGFCYSLSMEQDMDADGFPEVLIGFPGHGWPTTESQGAALLYYGPIEGAYDLDGADAVFYGSDPDWNYGYVGGYVRGLGDTDGDGFDDILIGAWGNAPAWVFRGGPR
jgi:hypothetical protein